MLRKVKLENFKSYGGVQEFKLAPITLIYGPNSAGKSSFIQALKLLKQTHDRARPNHPLLFSCRDGLVDLKSYQNTINRHDLNKPLGISLEFDRRPPTDLPTETIADIKCPPPFSPQNTQGDNDFSEVTCITDVEWPSPFAERHADGFDALWRKTGQPKPLWDCDRFSCSFRFASDGHSGLLLETVRATIDDYALKLGLKREHGLIWRGLFTVITNAEYARDFFIKFKDDIKTGYVKYLEYRSAFSGDKIEDYKWLVDLFDMPADKILSDIFKGKSIAFRSCGLLRNWASGLDAEHGYDGIDTKGCEGFLKLLFYACPKYCYAESGAQAGLCWDDKYGNLNDVISAMAPCATPEHFEHWIRFFDIELSCLYDDMWPLAPVRPSPQSVYNVAEEDDQYGSGYVVTLANMAEEDRIQAVSEINRWLKRMDIKYEIAVKKLDDTLPDHWLLQLYDLSQGSERIAVNPADVGYGISQILPIIVRCVAMKTKTILIEQPELHIHPRLQAELGELFKEAVKQQNHQLLVETHSEHLMLRIQKLIRKGELKPEDVSVLYVSRGEDGSSIQRLRLNSRGMFIDPWPDGFFPERLDEIMG